MSSLKYVQGRVIVSANLESKNSHQFSNGTKITLERGYNNFNRRESQPTNAIVISAEDIPMGCEILIHHNALHDSNRIFNYKPLSGAEEGSDIKYFSIKENECFAWRDENGELKPMKNFAFGLRVYAPYKGFIEGIEPELINDVLYITTGELEGKICHTLDKADYQIVFQGKDNREDNVIRCRHFEDEYNEQEEIIAVSHDLTSKLQSGELLIGLTPSKAKTLEITAYAD